MKGMWREINSINSSTDLYGGKAQLYDISVFLMFCWKFVEKEGYLINIYGVT